MSDTVVGLIKGIGDLITDADDAFLNIVGYTRAELDQGNVNWREMTPPELRHLDEAGMRQALAAASGGFTQPYQKVYIRKDGSRAPVLLCCALIPGAAPEAWMGYAVDLSRTAAAAAQSADAVAGLATVDPTAFHQRLITELVRERAKLLSIFDSSTSMMWSVDRQLRLLIANEAFHRRTGTQLGRRLSVGDPVIDASVPEAVRALWEAWYRRALAGEVFVTQTTDEADARTWHWEHSFAPIRDQAGQVVGASVVCLDVSDRVRSEQRLAQSRRDLTEAQRIAGVGSWEWYPATNQTHWSDEMFRIYDRDPALGAPTYEELAPYHRAEDLEVLGQMVARALATGEPYELDTSFQRRDGSQAWVTGRGEPVRSNGGAIVGLRGATLDITQRMQAELAVKRSENELLEAQRIARVGSWDWDVRTGTTTWSPMLRELLAWPADRPVPPFEEQERFFAPESWRRLTAAVQDAVTRGLPYTLELELTEGGAVRWIVARGEPVRDETGAIVGLHGITLDVTDRRQADEDKRYLERQLVQSQKMEAVGQLAGGVAHDFNNLLTALMFRLNALTDARSSLSPEVAAGLLDIETEITRAAKLTRQLLMFSRRQALDLRPIELNPLIDRFLGMLSRLIGEQVTLRFDAAQDHMFLNGDAVMIEQVLMNLVVNARDAMPHGGTVTVRTRRVTVSSEATLRRADARAGEFVELEVADTGTGIPAEQRERLFEPFFTTKEPGKGTGLGLATAYGIVAQHGGWIEVDSEVGVGSTFRVRLPCATPNATPNEGVRIAEPAPRAVNEHVLLVEDEPALRRLLVRALERQGYSVEAAANGPEALRLWESNANRFHIVVTDMVLPGGTSGFELLQHVAQTNPAVPRLLMSGYSADIVDGKLTAPATIRVLSKPFTASEFARTVREVLDSH